MVENQLDKSRKQTEKLAPVDQKTSRETKQNKNKKTQPIIPENKQENLARQNRKQAEKLSRNKTGKLSPADQETSRKTRFVRAGNKQKS